MFSKIDQQEISRTGKYTIKFFVDGTPKEVIIDDYFPCTEETRYGEDMEETRIELLSTPFQFDKVGNRKIIWPMLIEKAFAKEFGSYEYLSSCSIDDAMMYITGNAGFRFNLLNEDILMKIADKSAWKVIIELLLKGFSLGAESFPKELMPGINLGIIPSHAYEIVNAFECDSNNLLEIKNPWGFCPWTGHWSEYSNKWSKRIQRMINTKKLEKTGKEMKQENLFSRNFVKYHLIIF